MVEIKLVRGEDLQLVWPHVDPYMQKAVKRQQPQLIDTDYLYSMAREGEAKLLVAMDGEEFLGAAVIRPEFWPLAKTCFIMAAGGKRGSTWLPQMTDMIEQIAILNDCKYVIGLGRKGWARATPSYSVGNAHFFKGVSTDG